MTARILVCDDETSMREMLDVLLRRAGYDVVLATGVADAKRALAETDAFDAVITDLMMPDGTGMDVLHATHARDEGTQVMMITAFATTEAAVEAMRNGAYDYVQKPFKNSELLATLEKALEKRQIVDENRTLRATILDPHRVGSLIGKSPAMQRVLELVRRAASARASVLITGESGTGKEMVARALHETGERKAGPFVAVNCGALPENLMESELFGHEKGSFTGADRAKEGLVRAANGGTLFLDEIGELSAPLQVKLLRVLQERMVRPVGGQKEIEVDVRVIAATNRDVESDVRNGRFRQDLFYRLNVLHIALPPLRERPDDIPVLAQHFLHKHAAVAHKRLALSADVMRWLVDYDYPGNVRELENIIERGVALAVSDSLMPEDLPALNAPPRSSTHIALPDSGLDLDAFLGRVEKDLMIEALARSKGNRTQAAKLVGMSFRSFRYRLAKFGFSDADDPENDS